MVRGRIDDAGSHSQSSAAANPPARRCQLLSDQCSGKFRAYHGLMGHTIIILRPPCSPNLCRVKWTRDCWDGMDYGDPSFMRSIYFLVDGLCTDSPLNEEIDASLSSLKEPPDADLSASNSSGLPDRYMTLLMESVLDWRRPVVQRGY